MFLTKSVVPFQIISNSGGIYVKAGFLLRNGDRDSAQFVGCRDKCYEFLGHCVFYSDADADAYRDTDGSTDRDANSDAVFPGRPEETVSVTGAD